MRILGIVFVLSVLGAHAQGSKQELEGYLSKFQEGKSLDAASWMISFEGDTVPFADYRGKWVLIDYWSVGCRPCLKELPALSEFSENNDIPNLEVVAVSVEPDQSRWEKLSPKKVLRLPNLYAGKSIENDVFGLNLSLMQENETFNLITTLPRYSLIDPNGVIVKKELEVKPSSSEFAGYIRTLIE